MRPPRRRRARASCDAAARRARLRAGRGSPSRSPSAAGAASPDGMRPSSASAVFTGIGFVSRNSASISGSSRVVRGARARESPARNARTSSTISRGATLRWCEITPLAADREHRQRERVVARQHAEAGRAAREGLRGLREIAARLLERRRCSSTRESRAIVSGIDSRAGAARECCRAAAADRRALARSRGSAGRCLPASACCSRARSTAPRRRRRRARRASASIASLVEFEPGAGDHRHAPGRDLDHVLTTARCSSCESVADSPVLPQGTSPSTPLAICHSTRRRAPSRSSAPSPGTA